MNIKDLIIKKRNKEDLNEEEIDYFINAYNNGEILNDQTAAMITLMYINGLTNEEMAIITNKVAETGKLQDIYRYSDRILEIHPIGGIYDKIVIAIMAICSTLKLPLIKVVDREIGFLDRLIGFDGYKLETDFDLIREQIEKNNIVIVNQPEDIAPVEKKLYDLRNDLACNDDIYLIAISLMSQKIAIGMKNIVFDISYGNNTYVKTYKDAKRLAKYLIGMGIELKKGVKCIITEQNEPIGKYYGNTLELREIKDILGNDMSEDIRDHILTIGNDVLQLINKNNNSEENKNLITKVLKDGSAYEKFENFLEQNNINDVRAEHIVPVKSSYEGYVEEIDISIIRKIAKDLEAIRYNKDDKLDIGAGLELCKKIGDKDNKDDIIGFIHTNDINKINDAIIDFQDAYKISNRKVKLSSKIKENI